MRVILFILGLLAIGAVALLYYPVSDESIRQTLEQESQRLQKQAKEARKGASLAVKDLNKAVEIRTRNSVKRNSAEIFSIADSEFF